MRPAVLAAVMHHRDGCDFALGEQNVVVAANRSNDSTGDGHAVEAAPVLQPNRPDLIAHAGLALPEECRRSSVAQSQHYREPRDSTLFSRRDLSCRRVS
jgi:hypothetical protein